MPLALTTHVINRDVTFATLGDEVVLLHTETGVYFGLDAVGTRIWQLLVERLDAEQIYTRLLDEYAIEPGALRADLDRFLVQLEQHGLITRSAITTG